MTNDDGGGPRERSAKLRAFYARFIMARSQALGSRVEEAFARVERERFAGPAPWFIAPVGGVGPGRGDIFYLATPDGDPAFLYQDVLVALDRERGINIGQPSLHALCIDALAIAAGETVVQVGAGSGYYTAILAELVTAAGRVDAFEIDTTLADRAARNLAEWRWVEVHARSGSVDGLPEADAIYVNAGVTQPNWSWLEALRPGGRLLFPLQPEGGLGGMLLVTKPREGGLVWPARFVSRAGFVACRDRQDEGMGRRLAAAFAGGGWAKVSSLHLKRPEDTFWLAGDGWWLS